MLSNYKYISYEKLLEEIKRNNNIQLCLYERECFEDDIVIENNFTDHCGIPTINFKMEVKCTGFYSIRTFILLLENNLVYKHNDKKDNWYRYSETPLNLYMHNKELFNKIYRNLNAY